MKTSPPLIEIRNLSLKREKPILKNIDWQVQSGEHWVILGANGSGKTTLLSALSAYKAPTSGKIFVFGQEYGATDWMALREKMGFVSVSLLPKIQMAMSATQVIISGKHARLMNWDEPSKSEKSKALEILDFIECLPLKDRPWASLSQGEQQRIWIGRALMADLKILILDEPCSGLDPVAREKFLLFIDRMGKKTSPAIILVTHHIEEIMPCFTHVLILKKGQVLTSGEKKNTLNSKNLASAYDHRLALKKNKDRFELKILK